MTGSATIRDLLGKQQRRGIYITYIIRSIFLCGLIVPTLFSSVSAIESLIESSLIGVSLIVSLYAIIRIHRGRPTGHLGETGAVIDSLLLCLLVFSWYFTLSSPPPERAFITKNLITVTSMFFIVINAFSINKCNPLLVGSAAVVIHCAVLVFAAADPDTRYSNTLLDITRADTVILNLFISRILALALFTAIVFYLTDCFTKMVYQGAQLEGRNSQLGRYFSPTIMARISRESDDFFRPGGQMTYAAVLFADIRGFTAMSESYSSDDIFFILSGYHNIFVDAIFRNHGTVDKFMGDGIMATFGIPGSSADSMTDAVISGIEALHSLAALNEKLRERGLTPIRAGIGIHYGPVIAGNIGTERRLEYTVIGDTVNTASRIESACKSTGKEFLISDIVYTAVKERFTCESVGRIELKGKKEPIELFSVIA